MKEHGAVYFGAIGGAGALLSRCIKKAEIIAYEDLGAETLDRVLSSSTARATTCMKPEEKSISNRSGKIIREYFQKSTRGARKMEKKKLVIGVIGADVHAVGNAILNRAFLDAGFDVTNLGVLVPQDEFIKAAV